MKGVLLWNLRMENESINTGAKIKKQNLEWSTKLEFNRTIDLRIEEAEKLKRNTFNYERMKEIAGH